MKRILSLIISVSLILSLFAFMPVSVSADESNITWIEVDQDYYDKNIKDKTFRNSYANTLAPQVNTATEIVWYFKLTEDIVTDKGIQYVGRTGETKTDKVVIDGQGYTVTINSPDGYTSNAALVGYVRNTSASVRGELEVRNLKLKGNICSTTGAGGIVAYVYDDAKVTITNTTIEEGTTITSTATKNYGAAGAVGYSYGGIITLNNVKNYANVTGPAAAGLVGYTSTTGSDITLTGCANYGNISSENTDAAAGLVLSVANAPDVIKIDKCFNASDIISGTSGGAALCYLRGTGTQAKATGYIKNSYNAGGAVSYLVFSDNAEFSVENCYTSGKLVDFTYGSLTLSNSYYLEGSVTGNGGEATSVTKAELEDDSMLTLLGNSFEFVTLDTLDYYTYPQIKGNTLYYDFKTFSPYQGSYTDNKSSKKGNITGLTDWETEENAKDFTDIFKVSEPGYYISSLYSYPGILGTTVIKTTGTDEEFTVDNLSEIYLATEENPTNISGLLEAGFTPLSSTDFLALKNGKKFYLSTKIAEKNETVSLGDIQGLTGQYTVFVKWVDGVKVNVERFENAQVKINGKDIVSGVYEFAKGSSYTLTATPDSGYYTESIKINGQDLNNISDKEVTLQGTFSTDTVIKILVKKYVIDNLEIINKTVNNTDTAPGAPTIIQEVTIKGNAKEFMAGKSVSFTLTDTDSQPPLFVKAEDSVKGDGEFTLVIKTDKFDDLNVVPSLKVGDYNINLSDYGFEKIYFPALKDVNDFISKLDKSSQQRFDENELTAHILDGNKAPAFDTDVFKLLTTAEQLKIAGDILSYNGTYDIDTVASLYNSSLIKTAFSNQSNSKVIEKAISEYNGDEYLKLTEDLYDEYLLSAYKDDIHTLLTNKTLITDNEIKEAFKVAVALSKVRKVDNYSNILSALNEYNGKVSDPSLTALLTSYSNMTDAKIDAASEYILKNYTKLSDKASVVNIVSYAVTNAQALLDEKLKENIGNVILPPSGNIGGGGGGSVSVIEKSNTTVDNQDETSKPEVIESVVQFNDIQNVSWAGEAINELFKMGVLQGREPGKFYPHNNITRAEFVKIVVTLFNLYDETAKASFTDVTKDNWAYTFVASALKEGIANGKSVSYFGADENITREEMAVMLTAVIYRLSEHEKLDERMTAVNKFTDGADISSFAENPVNMLSAEGLISGYEDGTFKPKNNSTRAEATHLIYTVYKYILK